MARAKTLLIITSFYQGPVSTQQKQTSFGRDQEMIDKNRCSILNEIHTSIGDTRVPNLIRAQSRACWSLRIGCILIVMVIFFTKSPRLRPECLRLKCQTSIDSIILLLIIVYPHNAILDICILCQWRFRHRMMNKSKREEFWWIQNRI